MKWIRLGVTVCVCLFFLMQEKELSTGDCEEKIVRYVALGDSIAGGYGLDDAQKDGYVALVQKELESVWQGVYAWNFGENGLKSKELFERLTDPSDPHFVEYNKALEKADLVTVSIGSNDLMQYLSQNPDINKLKKEGDMLFSKACTEFDQTLPRLVAEIEKRA
ncbi:MAG: SGNH/GDSL hydrolase family protein, partial [Eubacterium sp.]